MFLSFIESVQGVCWGPFGKEEWMSPCGNNSVFGKKNERNIIQCYVHSFPGDPYRKIKKQTFPPLVKQMKDSVFTGLPNNPPNIQQQYIYFSHFRCFMGIKDFIYKLEIAIYIISTIQIENQQHLTFLINNIAAIHINSCGMDASPCAIISFKI